jgi:hypothetical protein
VEDEGETMAAVKDVFEGPQKAVELTAEEQVLKLQVRTLQQ